MEELAQYQEGYARVIVSRDGEDLVFWSDFDDNGRSIVSESRTAVADYVAKGEGPWPWYDLRDRQAGALQVLSALGIPRQPWTEPLAPKVFQLFQRAGNGWASVGDLLATGIEVDTLDACGATPLWYAVRSLQSEAALVLIEAGADAGRRIDCQRRVSVSRRSCTRSFCSVDRQRSNVPWPEVSIRRSRIPMVPRRCIAWTNDPTTSTPPWCAHSSSRGRM
jgi:hypothetical protein